MVDDFDLDDDGMEDGAEASLDDFFQPADSGGKAKEEATPSIDDFFAEPDSGEGSDLPMDPLDLDSGDTSGPEDIDFSMGDSQPAAAPAAGPEPDVFSLDDEDEPMDAPAPMAAAADIVEPPPGPPGEGGGEDIPAEPKKSGGIVKTLIIVAVLLVVLAGGGVGGYMGYNAFFKSDNGGGAAGPGDGGDGGDGGSGTVAVNTGDNDGPKTGGDGPGKGPDGASTGGNDAGTTPDGGSATKPGDNKKPEPKKPEPKKPADVKKPEPKKPEPKKPEPKKPANKNNAVLSDGGPYSVQVGSYYLEASKRQPLDQLAELGYKDTRWEPERRRITLYHVLVGKGLDSAKARDIKDKLEDLGYAAEIFGDGSSVKAYSYGSRSIANNTRRKVSKAGLSPVWIKTETKDVTMDQLRVGSFSRSRANRALRDLKRAGFRHAIVVRN